MNVYLGDCWKRKRKEKKTTYINHPLNVVVNLCGLIFVIQKKLNPLAESI